MLETLQIREFKGIWTYGDPSDVPLEYFQYCSNVLARPGLLEGFYFDNSDLYLNTSQIRKLFYLYPDNFENKYDSSKNEKYITVTEKRKLVLAEIYDVFQNWDWHQYIVLKDWNFYFSRPGANLCDPIYLGLKTYRNIRVKYANNKVFLIIADEREEDVKIFEACFFKRRRWGELYETNDPAVEIRLTPFYPEIDEQSLFAISINRAENLNLDSYETDLLNIYNETYQEGGTTYYKYWKWLPTRKGDWGGKSGCPTIMIDFYYDKRKLFLQNKQNIVKLHDAWDDKQYWDSFYLNDSLNIPIGSISVKFANLSGDPEHINDQFILPYNVFKQVFEDKTDIDINVVNQIKNYVEFYPDQGDNMPEFMLFEKYGNLARFLVKGTFDDEEYVKTLYYSLNNWHKPRTWNKKIINGKLSLNNSNTLFAMDQTSGVILFKLVQNGNQRSDAEEILQKFFSLFKIKFDYLSDSIKISSVEFSNPELYVTAVDHHQREFLIQKISLNSNEDFFIFAKIRNYEFSAPIQGLDKRIIAFNFYLRSKKYEEPEYCGEINLVKGAKKLYCLIDKRSLTGIKMTNKIGYNVDYLNRNNLIIPKDIVLCYNMFFALRDGLLYRGAIGNLYSLPMFFSNETINGVNGDRLLAVGDSLIVVDYKEKKERVLKTQLINEANVALYYLASENNADMDENSEILEVGGLYFMACRKGLFLIAYDSSGQIAKKELLSYQVTDWFNLGKKFKLLYYEPEDVIFIERLYNLETRPETDYKHAFLVYQIKEKAFFNFEFLESSGFNESYGFFDNLLYDGKNLVYLNSDNDKTLIPKKKLSKLFKFEKILFDRGNIKTLKKILSLKLDLLKKSYYFYGYSGIRLKGYESILYDIKNKTDIDREFFNLESRAERHYETNYYYSINYKDEVFDLEETLEERENRRKEEFVGVKALVLTLDLFPYEIGDVDFRDYRLSEKAKFLGSFKEPPILAF